jgi:undecaprenyl-diphosphatase
MFVGSVPAAIAGFTLAEAIDRIFFGSTVAVSAMLILTGFVLISARFARKRDRDNRPGRSFLIGIAQSVALIPGISRSGSTIVAGLHLGLSPEEAGRFSFLLALPAIFGASLLEFGDAISGGIQIEWLAVAAGTVAAFLSGYLAIRWVMRLLSGRGFPWFAFYLWAIGLFGLIVGF